MKLNLPGKSDIIFFDVVDDIILNVFKKSEVTIINLRTLKKEINFFIFLKIFISINLIKILISEGFLVAYISSYIEYSNASKVITCVDNNIRFYRLKKYFKSVKFVSIQNGARHVFMDIFGNPNLKKKLSCDDIFVFGNSIKDQYKKYINSNVQVVGCFRNNNYKIFKIKKKNTILFLSQFRNFSDEKIMKHFGKDIITWKNLNKNLYNLLPNIIRYCKKNNLKFGILSAIGTSEEYHFFKKILGSNYFWSFYKPKDSRDAYKILDMNEIVVNVWSTMGLESLSRGNKTCFFRQSDFGFNDRHFGWPKKYLNKGLFYTNSYDYITVSDTLNKIRNTDLKDWKNIANRFNKDNLIYNYQNSKLFNLIKE